MNDDTQFAGVGRLGQILLGSIVVAALFGAVLGYALSSVTGLDQVTVLAITFSVSTTSVAAYAAVAAGTFVATLALVFAAIQRLE